MEDDLNVFINKIRVKTFVNGRQIEFKNCFNSLIKEFYPDPEYSLNGPE